MKITPSRVTGVLGRMDMQFAALLIQFLISIAFNLMGNFLPLFLSSDLGYTLIEATYWTGVCQLISSSMMACSAPFWGFMCDRIGTKKVLTFALAGNTLVYAGMALSTSITQIMALRALQGIFGGMSTITFSLVASIVQPSELKKALSYQLAAMTFGSLFGPGSGGLIASIVGYRLTFVATSLIFASMLPMVHALNMPPPTKREETRKIGAKDLKSLAPDFASLILVYACINFITPIIPWFLNTMGVPNEQLLSFTAVITTLNGLAFALATPALTKIATDKTLSTFSVAAAAAIFATTFAGNPLQFLALRIIIGTIQAGVPPNLLGGKTGRVGMAMGILNSARFLGSAVGPFVATSVLGDGQPPKAMYMFGTLAGMSLATAFVTYLSHTRRPQPAED